MKRSSSRSVIDEPMKIRMFLMGPSPLSDTIFSVLLDVPAFLARGMRRDGKRVNMRRVWVSTEGIKESATHL